MSSLPWHGAKRGGWSCYSFTRLCLLCAIPVFAYCVRTQNVFLALGGILVCHKQNKVLKRLFVYKTDITHANRAKGSKCSMAIGIAIGRYYIDIYILYRKLKQNFEFSALTNIYMYCIETTMYTTTHCIYWTLIP